MVRVPDFGRGRTWPERPPVDDEIPGTGNSLPERNEYPVPVFQEPGENERRRSGTCSHLRDRDVRRMVRVPDFGRGRTWPERPPVDDEILGTGNSLPERNEYPVPVFQEPGENERRRSGTCSHLRDRDVRRMVRVPDFGRGRTWPERPPVDDEIPGTGNSLPERNEYPVPVFQEPGENERRRSGTCSHLRDRDVRRMVRVPDFGRGRTWPERPPVDDEIPGTGNSLPERNEYPVPVFRHACCMHQEPGENERHYETTTSRHSPG